MSLYLVEHRLPRMQQEELLLLQTTLSTACVRLTERGHAVTYLGSTFLPASSRLLSLFEAAEVEVVRRVTDSSQAPAAQLEVAIRLAHIDKEE